MPTRCSRYSNEVTTPKFPPPPRTPQKRSSFSVGLAYDVTEAAEPEGFEFAAAALLDGDTDDWTVNTLPVEEIVDVPLVAEYDGTTGEVRLLADRVGGTSPGHAARTYIGALHYGEQPATEAAQAQDR